jgi:hypothetical protein
VIKTWLTRQAKTFEFRQRAISSRSFIRFSGLAAAVAMGRLDFWVDNNVRQAKQFAK